ncbi:MAG: TolC family protein [Candidatus Aminicenantes bacterium]|nr:TolC family protein [Candidatus Aminicenantes bacterium]
MAASRTIRIETVRRDQAAAGLVLSRKNLLPDLSVGLYLPSVRTGAWGFELSLSLPFVWKNGRRGETLEAEARSEISSIAAAAVRTRVAAGIESAFAGLKAVEEQVRLFEEKLLDDVARQIEAGLADYRIGRLDSLGLIDLYRTAAEARAEYWRSLLLYEEAWAELERSGEENGEMGESHED